MAEEDILDTLNGPQKEAVLDDEHTLLVLAGAGSGKTRVITTKIVHSIRDLGYRPWQILAVTFTNKAAKEMRVRVERMLGEGWDLSGLEIKTFHSYGAGLLRKYSDRLGYDHNFNIYDDADSLALLSNLFPGEGKQQLKAYAKRISLLKDMAIMPDDQKLDGGDLPAFRMHYQAYENGLRQAQCMDFADLILKANELLEENPDVKDILHRRYRLILVDEYQDSNGSQFRFLKNLVGQSTQLVVVGDDDQSIYRFRGADIGNILSFSRQYSNVRQIKLEENYRSSGNIIALAGELISHNRSRHKKTIFTNNPAGPLPRLVNCYGEEDEALAVVGMIGRDLGAKDTAILFRTNAQSRPFEQALVQARIKYQVVGALRFYEREEVKDMLAVFALVMNPRDKVSFTRIVNKPARGIGKSALQKILSISDHTIDAMEDSLLSAGLTKGAKGGVTAFLEAYRKVRGMLESASPLQDFATACMKDFGFLDLYSKEEDEAIRKSRLENLNALVTAMSSFAPSYEGLAAFMETVTLDNSSLPGEEGDGRISTDPNVVKLITMHNTKGLEFDTVFVTGLEDDIIPGNRMDMSQADVEEERRILGIDDSKKLSAKKREALAEKIKAVARAYAIAEVDAATIDEINILLRQTCRQLGLILPPAADARCAKTAQHTDLLGGRPRLESRLRGGRDRQRRDQGWADHRARQLRERAQGHIQHGVLQPEKALRVLDTHRAKTLKCILRLPVWRTGLHAPITSAMPECPGFLQGPRKWSRMARSLSPLSIPTPFFLQGNGEPVVRVRDDWTFY